MTDSVESSKLFCHGFVQLRGALTATEIHALSNKFQDIPGKSAGQRWIGDVLASLLADEGLMSIRAVLHSLATSPIALRAVAFRKCADANWFVPPHQDRSVPIPSRDCPEGFSRRTRKGDGWQAEAPVALLEQMRNLRIFIDPASESDGPLEVLPGSHRKGRLMHAEIAKLEDNGPWVSLTGDAGDVVALSPLLVHRSQRADSPRGRRVLQIEVVPSDVATSHGLTGQMVPPPIT